MGKIKYKTISDVRNNVGENIVIMREKQNMSQTDLVTKLNLMGCTADRYVISSIENNHSCDLNLLADIKNVLNCTWEDLLD